MNSIGLLISKSQYCLKTLSMAIFLASSGEKPSKPARNILEQPAAVTKDNEYAATSVESKTHLLESIEKVPCSMFSP